MDELDKYNSQIIEANVVDNSSPESTGASTFSMVMGLLRRWYIILAIFTLVCSVGIPAIWLLKKPEYNVAGLIRVAPILTNLLSGEQEKGEISNYESFVNTEAIRITSGPVVERVADELVNKNLSFFKNYTAGPIKKIQQMIDGSEVKPSIASILKEMISNEVLNAQASRKSEFITVQMKDKNTTEAKQIVDAFIRAYMAIAFSDSSNAENQKLSLLENEQKLLFQKMESQRETIFKLGQEFGDTSLDGRYGIKLQRVSALLTELTKLESERVRLELEVTLLEENPGSSSEPTELLRVRQDYINSDSRVAMLVSNITQLEQGLIAAHQILAPSNPELKVKAQLIAKLNERLEELKKEAGENFDSLITKSVSTSGDERLVQAQAALERTKKYEDSYREMLSKVDTEAIDVGRKQLTITDLKNQLVLTKERYDQYTRRIQELEIEQKLPARISVSQYADIASVADKRIKLSLAVVFAAIAVGVMVAFLMSKADHRMWVPEDLTRKIEIRIIGTTTAFKNVKKNLLPECVEEDFHTICANLGLFSENGQEVPKKLVITSPGSGDGKTTSSINLAISLSKTGKRVLLIDGDLRKPDIGHLLNLSQDLPTMRDLISGESFDRVVCHLPLNTNLDILLADSHNPLDAYKFLSQLKKNEYMEDICQRYDHVVIDTPPILAFPDARIWAKMVGSAVLTGLAGRTTGLDLKKAVEQLSQVNVKILGMILCNVQADKGYYDYAYKYYEQMAKKATSRKRANAKKFLMPIPKLDNDNEESDL